MRSLPPLSPRSTIRRALLVAAAIVVLSALSPAQAWGQLVEDRRHFQGCTQGLLNRICSEIRITTTVYDRFAPLPYSGTKVDVTHTVWTTTGVLRQGSMTSRFDGFDLWRGKGQTTPNGYCDWNGIFVSGCATTHQTLEFTCGLKDRFFVKLSATHRASSNILNSVILTPRNGGVVRYLDPCTGRTRSFQ